MTDTTTLERTTQSATTILDHWVDGGAWAGASTRTAPVYNPALGIGPDGGAARLDRRRRRRRRLGVRGAGRQWRDASIAKRQTVMFAFRELLNARKGELAEILTSEHGKVLSDALGEIARGMEVVEFACGARAPDQGRLLRERLDRHRRLHAAPAARRRRHHQPVQLPGDGAAVVLLDRDRRRQRRGAEALREGPERRELDGRAAQGGRPARRRAQRRARRQGGRRRAARAPRRARDLVRRLDARSRSTSTRRRPAHGKRVQALGGAKNHMLVLPDADLDLAADAAVNAGFGSAGERCMAISVVLAVDTIADEFVEKVTRADGHAAHRRRHARLRHGPAHHRGAPRQGRVVHRRRGIRRRLGRRRRPRRRARRRPRRLLARPDPHRQGADVLVGVPRRDLRPGALGRARRRLRGRASASSTAACTATARRSSRTTAAPRGASSARCRSA